LSCHGPKFMINCLRHTTGNYGEELQDDEEGKRESQLGLHWWIVWSVLLYSCELTFESIVHSLRCEIRIYGLRNIPPECFVCPSKHKQQILRLSSWWTPWILIHDQIVWTW
jgi:hypothetical protein